MRKLGLLFLSIFSFSLSFCQLKQLTMTDAMVNARTSLAPENLRQLQFVKGTNDYVYLTKINGADVWLRKNCKEKKEAAPWLTLMQFNAYLRKSGIDTAVAMPSIQFFKNHGITTVKGQKIQLNWADSSSKILVSKAFSSKENLDESSAGYLAFVEDNNLFVVKDNQARKITEDGSKNIVYASTVHQSEFGITKGTFWSPNGQHLAYYRMDQTMVPEYPIVDYTTRPAKMDGLKYPMAGDASHHVSLHIYNCISQKITQVAVAGPAEQFLTNVGWSPDNRYVYIVIVNREQNHFWVNQYDADNGAFIKTLFEESDDKYAEPLVPMLFVKNNPGQFIWQSRRDGWNHLYLYQADGSLIKQLTSGSWDVTEVKGFDEKGERLFFVSTQISPISKNLFELNLKSGVSKAITSSNEIHNTQISSSGEFVLDNYSSPENPRTIQLIDNNKSQSTVILKVGNPLAAFETGKMSIFTIKNNAGTELYCRLFQPAKFDSTQKYPVVVYWYGGPHAQMITNAWNGGAGDYWFQYMAERGYVVFTLDTRGSSNRGKVFEQEIFRKAGEKQMEDLMSGIDYLKSLNYIDTQNMGLFGWSYGGFMTTDFMLTHPGIFKAAVAGGPVIDWKYYEIMYTERYMDTPQENPEGYAATDLTKKIGNLKGKLFLIHGMQDNVVLMQHSVNLVKAAVDRGVQVDYMIYPGHEHNVLGKDRAHLYQKVTDYFMQHLK